MPAHPSPSNTCSHKGHKRKRFPLGSVYHAAKGSRIGPKSLQIRQALEAFLKE